ncbi:unnamed protein product [Cylicocyclus nassatus]|uniref:Uncharacterized protein n=1 Tax=Cylicocyclus nassatus TaxID=53992 RepID=A0AA36MB23_CYLNA|nr:unnamed protein product [Cylicocyclus nassatus]
MNTVRFNKYLPVFSRDFSLLVCFIPTKKVDSHRARSALVHKSSEMLETTNDGVPAMDILLYIIKWTYMEMIILLISVVRAHCNRIGTGSEYMVNM